jgi:multiple antibiotic resistance protein
MWALIVHASVILLVILDPVGLAALFVALTAGRSAKECRRQARHGVLIAAGVLYVFALAGRELLTALGVSLAAFRIAGGALLFLVAIEMVFARHSGLRSTTSSEEAEAHLRADISVFPLAIPLIAGPGAIACVMLLMGEAAGSRLAQFTVLAVLAAALAVTFAALHLSHRVLALLGITGINVVGRVLGIVLAALAVQFILDGMHAVLAGGG